MSAACYCCGSRRGSHTVRTPLESGVNVAQPALQEGRIGRARRSVALRSDTNIRKCRGANSMPYAKLDVVECSCNAA